MPGGAAWKQCRGALDSLSRLSLDKVFDICQTEEYCGCTMALEKRITTRELLRSFKKYKEMLLQGKMHCVFVNVDRERRLRLSVDEKVSTGEDIARAFSSLKKPIRIKRTHIFDELLRGRKT